MALTANVERSLAGEAAKMIRHSYQACQPFYRQLWILHSKKLTWCNYKLKRSVVNCAQEIWVYRRILKKDRRHLSLSTVLMASA